VLVEPATTRRARLRNRKSVQGKTLKAIFGNGAVAKLFWDVRCDRHALLFPWGVDVDGAVDLQLVDLAQQVAPGRTPRSVSGLGWVLENTSRAGWSTGAERTWPSSSAQLNRSLLLRRGARTRFGVRGLLQKC
jgi:hypothetical protein